MIPPVRLCALDHGPWLEVQAGLRQALDVHGLVQFIAPATIIVHDLLDNVLKAMQLQVFRHIMETDLGLRMDDQDEQLQALFRLELSEHGSQNIAGACRSEGRQVTARFLSSTPCGEQALIQIEAPCAWERGQCHSERLIEALGLRLEVSTAETGSSITLLQRAGDQPAIAAPELLDAEACAAGMTCIFDRLAYGLIHFSALGQIVAASPTMLTRLHLDTKAASMDVLAAAIPLSFYNDVIWGQALVEGGVFENYRIRVNPPGAESVSILFNVSGFRQHDGSIHSLWQVVSHDAGGARLAEGAILSEVRVHNITRNYVPQLVEQRAREAVRMGKNSLGNEERPVAVLFCDIVGFTSYVERNADSESIIDTLNSILRRVSGQVRRNHGAIDKFMGDCIMALFDEPSDAVLAALDMQSHAEDINALRSRAGQQMLQLRIGIHWGVVIVGNVGTEERLDWTAIGDVVNTASRIEKNCHPGAVLISQDVRDEAGSAHPGRFEFDEMFSLQVKGKRDELMVCHVRGAPITKAI